MNTYIRSVQFTAKITQNKHISIVCTAQTLCISTETRHKDLTINMQESLVVVVVFQKRSLHNVHKEVCQIGYLLVQLVHEKVADGQLGILQNLTAVVIHYTLQKEIF